MNKALGVRILVGDSVAMRDKLVRDVAKGLLLPALLILPLLATLIWLSVGRGLAPLNGLADILSKRDEKELHPLVDNHAAREITPVIASLNGLFGRVAQARDRERNFTAYAAHELKTPLAGLKTQAQIALRTPDSRTQQSALRHIISSVDRTSRMVKQLIDLAAADSSEADKNDCSVDLVFLMQDIARELAESADAHKVSIVGPALDQMTVENTNTAMLRLAIRNILENAIQHSPEAGEIQYTLFRTADGFGVSISDQGPGIRLEDCERVTERFFRGRENSQGNGSGLGLSIVSMVAEKLNGTLAFEHGERFSVEFCLRSNLPACA
jgi:two-component system, OmpR family, sensor histidine kinase QseC